MDSDLRQHGDVRRTSEPRGDDDSVMPAPPSQHEVDVVALERASGVPDHLLMLGEAKWRADAVGVGEMERLRHIRELVGTPAGRTRLVLFSRSGFTDELVEEAKGSPDVELVDLERLYSGS